MQSSLGRVRQRALAVIDGSLAAVVLAASAPRLLRTLLRARRLSQRRRQHERRIVYFGTGQIAQVFPRNGVNLFFERECSDFGGFFQQLWNVHFPAGARGELDLGPRHHLLDFDVSGAAPLVRLLPRAATAVREVRFLDWAMRFVAWSGAGVVTATNPHLQGLNAVLVGWALRLPVGVIITRDFDWDWSMLKKQAVPSVFPSRGVEKRIERWVLSRAQVVFADRVYYAAFALRNGASAERVVTTRVLADRAYEQAPVVTAPEDGPLLTYVGRLDADKLVLDLIEVLRLVRERFPRARLACAGTGAQETALRAEAAASGVADGLQLLGGLALPALAALLARSDLVVAPHMGYTLVEAGLTGVPIATYDYDYHPEIVRDDWSGALAPFRDVAALAQAVCAYLDDPALAAEQGARLRRYLAREHSLARVTELYRAAYAEVLAGVPRQVRGLGSVVPPGAVS